MAIFYHQVVFWVSRSEAEWLSIMFVRGDFIEEHWDLIGCWAHTHARGGGEWELALGEWLYWICRHVSFFVANKPCPQSDSFVQRCHVLIRVKSSEMTKSVIKFRFNSQQNDNSIKMKHVQPKALCQEVWRSHPCSQKHIYIHISNTATKKWKAFTTLFTGIHQYWICIYI